MIFNVNEKMSPRYKMTNARVGSFWHQYKEINLSSYKGMPTPHFSADCHYSANTPNENKISNDYRQKEWPHFVKSHLLIKSQWQPK